jgi:hypothetical protein
MSEGKSMRNVKELSMFHNLNAKMPVPPELFPSITHHEFRDGQVYSLTPEFHSYTSMTFHLRVAESKPGDSSDSISQE